jgi:hypothetical protein
MALPLSMICRNVLHTIVSHFLNVISTKKVYFSAVPFSAVSCSASRFSGCRQGKIRAERLPFPGIRKAGQGSSRSLPGPERFLIISDTL